MSESESKRTPRKRGSRARRGQDTTSGETATSGQPAVGEGGATGRQEFTGGGTTSERGEVREAEIRRRAYELYIARGGTPGAALDDWLAAEHELRGERGDGTSG